MDISRDLRMLKNIRGLPAISAATTSKTSTRSSGTIFSRPCFIDRQISALQRRAIDLRNGTLSLVGVRHFHKRKALGPPGVTIGDKLYGIYLSVLLECLPNIIFGRIVGNVPYIDVHGLSPWKRKCHKSCLHQYSQMAHS